MTNTIEREMRRPVAGPDAWLQKLRDEAYEQFEAQGFPTTQMEDWRHTNVGAIASTPFQRPAGNSIALPPEQLDAFATCPVAAARIVFVNGRYTPEFSHLGALSDGIHVRSLAEALRTEPDRLERHLGRYAAPGKHPFAALNTAYFEDGAFVEIDRRSSIPAPIVLLHLSTAEDQPTASHPRHLIVAGEDSVASVVEVYAGMGDGVYLTNAVTEVHVGEGAILDHVKVQRESLSAFHIGVMAVRQEARSAFTAHSLSLGGRLVRNDVHARLSGPEADTQLNGLAVGDAQRHVDNHTVIEHAAERCGSREKYHTILSDSARGVFAGRIIVRPGAQKTDARQSSRNLLLSREAVADAMPQLEIFADDVKCTHGATVGCLDEEAVFYLRSRGVPEASARGLLTYAFANEILESIRVEALRVRLQHKMLTRMAGEESA